MSHLFDAKNNPRKAFTAIGVLLAILVIFPFFAAGIGLGNAWVRMLDIALLYIMLALGLNVVVGFAGLLDLGYVAFFAVGAYMSGLLASPQFSNVLQSFVDNYPELGEAMVSFFGPEITQHGIHLSVWVIVPLSAALAALFGVILGAPTLKLRGDYLAIVTLGFGEIIRIFMTTLYTPVNITNGPQGINLIDPVSIFGMSLAGEAGSHGNLMFGSFSMPMVNAYYFLFLVLAAATIFITLRLQNSRLGRAFVAIREDEIAAKAMGINTRNIKLLAFSMGASFGGIAGAMFAAFQGFVSPESFNFNESIAILAMVVLGGMGHIPGVVLGGVILAILPEVLRQVVEPAQQAAFGSVIIPAEVMRDLVIGSAMVGVMLKRPAGLWPAPKSENRPDHDIDKPAPSTNVVAA